METISLSNDCKIFLVNLCEINKIFFVLTSSTQLPQEMNHYFDAQL